MPTKRRRHTITEVGDVEQALERVRAVDGEPDIRELVVLGAQVLAQRAAERERLKERLIERSTTGEGIELEAAEEVRHRGWARPL